MTGRQFLAGIALVAVAGVVGAKLPQPQLTDEQKAKAEEAKAKAAHAGKVANFKLCQSMDRVAERYIQDERAKGKDVKVTATEACADPSPGK